MIRNIAIYISSLYLAITVFIEKELSIFSKLRDVFVIIILLGVQTALGQDSLDSLSGNNRKGEIGRFRYVDVKGHYGNHLYTGQSLGRCIGLL